MACNFACCCILVTFRTVKIMVSVWWFFLLWCYFDLVKRVKLWVSGHFGHFLWIFLNMVPLWLKMVIFGASEHYLGWGWGGGGIFPTFCVEFCLVFIMFCIYSNASQYDNDCLIFMSQTALHFLHSTLVLLFYIDVVLTLSMLLSIEGQYMFYLNCCCAACIISCNEIIYCNECPL